MTENDTLTEEEASLLRAKLGRMILGCVQWRLLQDIGYMPEELSDLSRRLERIARQAQQVDPSDERFVRLFAVLHAQPRIGKVLAEAVGMLLGTGGWLVTPHDRMAPTAADAFERFLNNAVALAERVAELNEETPDA